ncbi:MAG: GIY-YIG nuclease family protein [Puniceicoccaceae bacterium]
MRHRGERESYGNVIDDQCFQQEWVSATAQSILPNSNLSTLRQGYGWLCLCGVLAKAARHSPKGRRRAWLRLHSNNPKPPLAHSSNTMYFVYQLRSISARDQHYTGFTKDLRKRLTKHNHGEVPHTSKHAPWELVNYFAFSEEEKAKDFETYLKSGSGRCFAKRHLW